MNNYLKIVIGDNEIVVTEFSQLPISINYSLEDSEEFQNKKSSESFDVEIPAIISNDIVSNTFRNASYEDMTSDERFRSWQKLIVECNGLELMVGKAFLKYATHDSKPISYGYNFLGDNGDWILLLTDKTLFDLVSHITFTFSKATIEASWSFDGTNENLPYVFAPVRYRFPFGDYTVINGVSTPDDDNVLPDYMRPALSKYWIIYWAFKSIGYRIISNFLDSEYFRRQVLPWTFANFLDSGGTELDAHKFLAKSVEDKFFDGERGHAIDEYIDLDVSNDGLLGLGAFDNNNDYSYVSPEMKWEYKIPDFGPLNAVFSAIVFYNASLSGSQSNATVRFDWFINGVLKQQDIILQVDSGIIGTQRPVGQTEVFFKTGDYGISVNVGDIVSAKVHLHLYRDKLAINDVAYITLNVLGFQLDYFRIEIGGTIDFSTYTSLQDKKFMEYFSGVIDEFDLSINTDSSNKIVYIEPTHPWYKHNDPSVLEPGYFNNKYIDWNGKEDISKTWKLENFSDIQKELIFKYKDDSNDGILKLVQDRNINILAQSKYVFPDRFLIGSKNRENRFFAPTMHYSVSQWGSLGTGANSGITPQIVCIIPENISNTSASESDNTFLPKSCYYKGNITGAGAWKFDGTVLQTYPYMFAVNYQSGGENDPILSYSDEKIGSVIGKGLVKRFFWQRLAIMRDGKRYNTFFKLNTIDVSNQLHREFKSYKGHKWELIEIKGYKPLEDDSSEVLLYKWSPITQRDFDNTFPSVNSLNAGTLSELDIKYAALKCLYSDIPT